EVEKDRLQKPDAHDLYLASLATACETYVQDGAPGAWDRYITKVRTATQTYNAKDPTGGKDAVEGCRRLVQCLSRAHFQEVRAAYWDEEHRCPNPDGIRSLADAVLAYLGIAYRGLQQADLTPEIADADYFVFALPVEQ